MIAKEIVKAEEEELVYDESSKPYFDENGVFVYANNIQYGLLITNGLHSEYTLKTTNNYARPRIQPTQSSANKKVTFTILTGEKNFKMLYFSNYDDLTIKATSNIFPLIRLMNVNKITFIDLNDQSISGINSDISGGRKINIVSDKPVSFNELYFRSSSAVDLQNSKCTYATVVESNPKIMNLQITQFSAYSSECILNNCNVNGGVLKFFITDVIPPSIYLMNNTKLNPSSIKVAFYKIYSAKLLMDSDAAYLLLYSEDTELINSLATKFSFVEQMGYFEDPTYSYKVVKSKDNKGIYLVTDDFNDAKAPETTTPIEDPFVDDDISDQDLDVNKPVPTEPPKPSNPTEPPKPSNPTDPSKPIDPTEPPKPSDPSKPTDPSKPIDPTEPPKPSDPTEPPKPSDPSKPTDPSKPIDPTEPPKPSDPTEPPKPSEPSKPTDPSKPIDPTEPPKPSDPSKPIDPTEPPKPAEPTEPSKPTDPQDSESSSNGGGNMEGGDGKKKGGLPIGAIIGIAVCALAVVVGVGVFAFIYIRRKRAHVSSTEGVPQNENKDNPDAENAETPKLETENL